jgi:hypothetical protein
MAWLAFVVIASIAWSVWALWSRNSPPRVVARTLEKVWRHLRTAHGMKDFYEGSEVAAALRAAAVTDADLVPFAYARYCRESDFLAEPACAGHGYRHLREQMLQRSRPFSDYDFPHRRKPNI